jgi:DNA-binding IclR family transcriptional regulator
MNDVAVTGQQTVTGAQSIARAAALLRAVGAGTDGITTAQAARSAEIARPTAHRILTSLQEAGLLDRDRKTGRWLLGPEIFLLGTVAARRYDVARFARPDVHALADATGESAFLSVRRGDETVCAIQEEGSFPLRSFVLQEGTRFPLGVASAGLAILSFVAEADAREYFARASLEGTWGPQHSERAIRERMALTRQTGYAVNPALILEGSWGMGAAVFNRQSQPEWAVSLTGVESRFRQARRPELGQLLLKCAHDISLKVQAQPSAANGDGP